jgi:nicotinamidase-related amidase
MEERMVPETHFGLVLLLLLSAATMAQQPADAQSEQESSEARVVQVPWHFYRHYPPDFSAWSRAARGFQGWTSEVRGLDLNRTALLLMHLPDAGLTADTEWGPDCPRPDLLGTVEWVPRTMDLCTNRLPRLVEAARDAGLQIVHVYGSISDPDEPCAARSLAEAGDPPEPDPERITANEAVQARHTRDVFDLPRPRPQGSPDHVPGLPEILRPTGEDLVVAQSYQLHRLMKNRGITHLLYTGWALNWCLWFSPCGMHDMQRKGYLCSAVRGACVAIENRESADTEANLEYAYWKTSTMFGYIFDLHELTSVLRDATE